MPEARLLVIGGGREDRFAAAAALLERESPGIAEWRLPPETFPFVRAPLAGAPPGSIAVVLHDAEGAFPDHQTGGTRLVLTQSSYSVQALVDRLRPGDRLIVTADAGVLGRVAPEALSGHGPWAGVRVVDIGRPGGPVGQAVDRPAAIVTATEPAPLLARAFNTDAAGDRARACRQAVADAPGSEVAWLALASACREQQDAAGAREAIDRAVALAPDWAAAHFEDGKLWLALEDLERARAAFGRASACMPSFAGAAANLGATLGELGRSEEALVAFERALARDPRNVALLNNVGVAMRELGRLDESAEACRRAVALAPEFVFGYYNLGHARLLAGAYGEAVAAYEEGQRRDPVRNRRQGCRLAVARFAAGDMAGAERDLWRSADAAPPEEREDLLLEAYDIVSALLARHPEREGDRGFLVRIGAAITAPPQS